MSNTSFFPVPDEVAESAWIDAPKYERMYAESISNPERFWAEHGRRLDWVKPFTKVKDVSYTGDVHVRWFHDGVLNASANCLDRHLNQRADQTAILWEGDDPKEHRHVSYGELHQTVCRLANVLKAQGIRKGDRVTIYMPMIPEATAAMLACARIGAIHSVVFGGFSPESLIGRIQDCHSCCVITADEGLRGGRRIPLKANTDEALTKCPGVKTCIVVRRTGGEIGWVPGRDHWYHELMANASDDCPPEPMNAEDPLFILYTSGSTGKPKGILHTTGGYLLVAELTHQIRLRFSRRRHLLVHRRCGLGHRPQLRRLWPAGQRRDHVMYEGAPNLSGRVAFWEIIDKHKVTIFTPRPPRSARSCKWGEAMAEETRSALAAPAGHRRRADQSGSLDVVSRGHRRQTLPDRRYLVANRNRRDHDHALPGATHQTRLRDAAVLRHRAGSRR